MELETHQPDFPSLIGDQTSNQFHRLSHKQSQPSRLKLEDTDHSLALGNNVTHIWRASMMPSPSAAPDIK